MLLLPVTGADDPDLVRGAEDLLHRLGEVADGAGGGLLDEDVPGMGVPEGEEDELYGLFETHEEAGHVRVGDGERFPSFDLLHEEGDTDPRDAMTLPYRVPQMRVFSGETVRDLATKTFSIMALDMPMALMG